MTALALAPNGVNSPTLSKVIDEVFGNDLMGGNAFKKPSTNIKEFDDHFEVELSTPGFSKKDFNMEVDNNKLTVSASSSEEVDENESYYRLREFRTSNFSRTFHLADTIDAEKISASYRDGILCVHLPKRKKPEKNHLKRSKLPNSMGK